LALPASIGGSTRHGSNIDADRTKEFALAQILNRKPMTRYRKTRLGITLYQFTSSVARALLPSPQRSPGLRVHGFHRQ
jgi:hypothetical protein